LSSGGCHIEFVSDTNKLKFCKSNQIKVLFKIGTFYNSTTCKGPSNAGFEAKEIF
jgi:hypothetical protein